MTSIKSTLTLFSSQPQVSFVTVEQEDSIYSSFKRLLYIYCYICAGRLVALCRKAKLLLQFILIVQTWATSGFLVFYWKGGRGKDCICNLVDSDNVLQLTKWPPFKFFLPPTDQVDITIGVYHKALVWQSPEIRCYFSWLHYWLSVFLYKGCFYLQWNARKEDELIRKNISQEAEAAIDFLWNNIL